MHIVAHDKGKPAARWGRKTTGPGHRFRTAGLPKWTGTAGLEKPKEAYAAYRVAVSQLAGEITERW